MALSLTLIAGTYAPLDTRASSSASPESTGPASDLERDRPSYACERLTSVSVFPYSDIEWLAEDTTESQWQDVASVEFLGAPVPFVRIMPDKIRAVSGREVSALSVYAGSFEQGFAVQNVGAKRREFAGLVVELLAAEAIEGSEILEFSRLTFDEQLSWYQEEGQGPFECTRRTAIRDLKKYLVEDRMALTGVLPGSAGIDQYGLSFRIAEGPQLFGIAPNGWLRYGGWLYAHGEFEEVAADFDAHEILTMFESLVLAEISRDEFRAYLESSGIEFEFREM